MDTHPDYTADWRDYRRRRRIFWILFLGFIPGVFILFMVVVVLLSLVSDIKPEYFFFWIAGLWMLMLIIAGFQFWWFYCPRCHKKFFATFWYRNPLTKKCLHCGLPKWANTDVTIPVPPQSSGATTSELTPKNNQSEPTEFVDRDGNRATVAFWGSAEKAQESLLTLFDCTRCVDCWACKDCFECKRSRDCYRCAGCDECSNCRDSGDCLRCVRCNNCDQSDERHGGDPSNWRLMVDCTDCSNSAGCLECSNCSQCISCVRCSGCRICERCTDCQGCSEISDVHGITKQPEAPLH